QHSRGEGRLGWSGRGTRRRRPVGVAARFRRCVVGRSAYSRGAGDPGRHSGRCVDGGIGPRPAGAGSARRRRLGLGQRSPRQHLPPAAAPGPLRAGAAGPGRAFDPQPFWRAGDQRPQLANGGRAGSRGARLGYLSRRPIRQPREPTLCRWVAPVARGGAGPGGVPPDRRGARPLPRRVPRSPNGGAVTVLRQSIAVLVLAAGFALGTERLGWWWVP